LATPNYGYEKRQRELAKKQKKQEKLKAKAERKVGDHARPGLTPMPESGLVRILLTYQSFPTISSAS
jgi:hypothetical protein